MGAATAEEFAALGATVFILDRNSEGARQVAAAIGAPPPLIGDVSDDGFPDLVFVNDSGVHQIWTAVGGDFELHAEQIIDIGAAEGVLADLGFADEGDAGGVDLALGGAPGAGVGVYLNDSAGNLGLGDAVAPTLSLLGDAAVEIESGTAYVDAGASVVQRGLSFGESTRPGTSAEHHRGKPGQAGPTSRPTTLVTPAVV